MRQYIRIVRKIGKQLVYVMIGLVVSASSVSAQSSSSGNYRVDQTFFGSGGETNLNSTNYSGRATAGELAIGETSSLNYRAYAGFNTTDEPYIEFVVTGDNVDLSYLDTAQAKTANGTFYVRAWQSNGYVVRTESDPPTNTFGSQQLTPLSTPATSVPGTEQFGINLVANTSPVAFGAAAQQIPDNSFSFGEAATGYDIANNYKYVKGDVIAQSPRSTSVTIYTLSYLFNIDQETPSGRYDFNHVLVATATY